jgi:hypothetical protein
MKTSGSTPSGQFRIDEQQGSKGAWERVVGKDSATVMLQATVKHGGKAQFGELSFCSSDVSTKQARLTRLLSAKENSGKEQHICTCLKCLPQIVC